MQGRARFPISAADQHPGLAQHRSLLWRTLVTAALILISAGCSTYARQVTPIRSAFYANQLADAAALIEVSSEKRPQDAEVLLLEAAMVRLADGDAGEAERLLRTVRDRFDADDDPQLAAQALAYGTDDQRLPYAGEDYEKILIRAFLAISNLLQDGSDAEAYSLQTIAKQEEILLRDAELSPAKDDQATPGRVALAPYLRGVLREATHRDFDDAERCYTAVVNWQPTFEPGPRDLQRAVYGRHSQPGNGVLYVFALTGRGPYKEEVSQMPSTASLLIASELVSQFGAQTVPPNVAPVKVPQVVARPNPIQAIAVSVNGQPLGTTATITDVTALALSHYARDYPRIVARAVARRLLKKGVVYAAKEVGGVTKGSLASSAVDLAAVAWEATESADTRCWGLLPDKIQVFRMELPAGAHVVSLLPVLAPGPSAGPGTQQTVEIFDGRNTYLLGHFPVDRLVGRVLVSEP
jgi:uncharacterized protein